MGNKKAFGAETLAILSPLRIFDQRKEKGRRYTIFADSTAAVGRARTDATGPGQFLARAAIEVCSRLAGRDNEVTIFLVQAHVGIPGNGEADRLAEEAAGGRSEMVPDTYRREASLPHLSQVAAERRPEPRRSGWHRMSGQSADTTTEGVPAF